MTDDYMCPFCVTPWKCNGPHIEPEDMAEFEAYSRSQYDLGFRAGLDAAEAIQKATQNERWSCGCYQDIEIVLTTIRALKEKPSSTN